MTHEAREAEVQQSLTEIRTLAVNRTEPFILRIEESA